MSGFAFSHQFSQRWLNTSPPIKQTIIQELEDIVKLLQPDTDFDSYRFSVPNLHDKVEQLMAIEAIRQEKIQAEERKREREEQERIERERLEAQRIENERLEKERQEQERIEQERLEKERIEQERIERERLEAQRIENEKLEKEHQEQQRLEQEQLEQEKQAQEQLEREKLEQQRLEQDQAEIMALENERAIAKQASIKAEKAEENPSSQSVTVERHSSEMVYAISDNQTPVNDEPSVQLATTELVNEIPQQTVLSPTDISAIKQQIIEKLQAHIDTYLQDSMAFMKSDLNQWLKDEVDSQLTEKLSQSN